MAYPPYVRLSTKLSIVLHRAKPGGGSATLATHHICRSWWYPVGVALHDENQEVPVWLLADVEEALQASRDGDVYPAAEVFAEIRATEEDANGAP